MTPTFRTPLPRRLLAARAGALAATLARAAARRWSSAAPSVGGALMATDRRTSGTQIDDQVIELKAERPHRAKRSATAATSTSTSYNRMVLLTGEVPSEADRRTAEQVVARIDNVRSVVNELAVGPPSSLTERSNDACSPARSRPALVDAKDLLANAIKVVDRARHRLPDGPRHRARGRPRGRVARGVSGVPKVVRVFEIVSEAELGRTSRRRRSAAERAARRGGASRP